jgi:hypothetical protein
MSPASTARKKSRPTSGNSASEAPTKITEQVSVAPGRASTRRRSPYRAHLLEALVEAGLQP